MTEAAIDFGKCGCGKPAVYISPNGGQSCNKYRRCPSYDEIDKANAALQAQVKELRTALFLTTRRCNSLHHGEKHQHGWDDPCPVEAIIEQAIRNSNS